MEYKKIYSAYKAKLNPEDKTITIIYTEHILDEPGIAEHFKELGKTFTSYIENSLKK